jgi:hypothetical protein
MTRTELAKAIVRSGALGILDKGAGCDRHLFSLGMECITPNELSAVLADISHEFGLRQTRQSALARAMQRIVCNESYADLTDALGREE